MGQCCLKCLSITYQVCHCLQSPCQSVLAEREGLPVTEREYEERLSQLPRPEGSLRRVA